MQGAAQNVFYNPIQQFNRDLSVLAIKTYGEDAIARKAAKSAGRLNHPKQRQQKGSNENKKRKRGQAGPVVDESFEKGPGAVDQGQPQNTPNQDGAFRAIEEAELVQNTVAIATESSNTPAPGPSFSILDALSATGLRALRYAHEIPFVTRILANDLSQDAAKSIQRNVVYNKLGGKIKAHQSNAIAHMYGFSGF